MSMRYLITGVASGLGQALAQLLLAKGHQVIGIDRNVPQWARDDEANWHFLLLDLAQLSDTNQIWHALKSFGSLDGVIHCAGVNQTGAFETMSDETIDAILSINLTAPITLTNQLIAQNQLEPDAQIVWVASLSHLTSYPGATIYAASKDGLVAYGKNLAYARQSNLKSICVFPGPLDTKHAYEHAPSNTPKDIARRLSPEKAAKAIWSDVEKGRSMSFPGSNAKLIALLARLAPGLVERIMVRQLFLPLQKNPSPRNKLDFTKICGKHD